jgi:chromate reductase, NAD(P)H dehydrogenase (quinone)
MIMKAKKNIFAIIGSASENSSNLKLVNKIAELTQEYFNVTVFDSLALLPHFNAELSFEHTPQTILDFREKILEADAILICTPEYVFSIPSRLKNAIEWCVATTVFSQKPLGIITASANGQKGHEELKLIMKTVEANFTEATTLLIPGIKSKIDEEGNILNKHIQEKLAGFVQSFRELVADATR